MKEINQGKRNCVRHFGLRPLAYVLYGVGGAALLGLLLLTGLQAIGGERPLSFYFAEIMWAIAPPLLLAVVGCGLMVGHGWARRLAYVLPVILLPFVIVWCGQAFVVERGKAGVTAELMSAVGLGAVVALPGATLGAILLAASDIARRRETTRV